MNWNNNNNGGGPWGSGGNNPWGGGSSNNQDFEDSIKKAKERFSKMKLGGPRNFSIFVIVLILIWLATGFYRVEPDEQGIELLFGKWNGAQKCNKISQKQFELVLIDLAII